MGHSFSTVLAGSRANAWSAYHNTGHSERILDCHSNKRFFFVFFFLVRKKVNKKTTSNGLQRLFFFWCDVFMQPFIVMDSLSCTVCCKRFNEEQHCPRQLGCGHTFCTGCLERLPRSASTWTNHRASRSEKKGLPKNFALLDVLLASPQTRSLLLLLMLLIVVLVRASTRPLFGVWTAKKTFRKPLRGTLAPSSPRSIGWCP